MITVLYAALVSLSFSINVVARVILERITKEVMDVGVVKYAMMAYLLTAIISFGVVAVIVIVNRVMSRNSSNGEV